MRIIVLTKNNNNEQDSFLLVTKIVKIHKRNLEFVVG